MTEEQIKQIAEVYAKERCIRYNEQYGACYDAYIAGAHGRDEEIEQLRKALSSAQQAMAELAQMARNPWIS